MFKWLACTCYFSPMYFNQDDRVKHTLLKFTCPLQSKSNVKSCTGNVYINLNNAEGCNNCIYMCSAVYYKQTSMALDIIAWAQYIILSLLYLHVNLHTHCTVYIQATFVPTCNSPYCWYISQIKVIDVNDIQWYTYF